MTFERLGRDKVDLVPELARLVPPAFVVDKHVYSPWVDTTLQALPQGHGVDTLVITGSETDVCVLATVHQAAWTRARGSLAGIKLRDTCRNREASMKHVENTSRASGSARGLLGTISLGVTTGVAAASAALLGRKVASVAAVGKGHPFKHRALDLAAGMLQRKYPVEAMSTYLNGFHFYADEMGRQVEASHFCIHLRHDLHQCVIFDSNRPDARLIGIEYIISAERFRSLPEDEKRLWHSHHYEVKSGMLVAPGIPELAERAYFKDLVTTYGKTFHTWQYDREDFPYGIPQLMMGFTEDGQVNEALVRRRDLNLGISTAARRNSRSDIATPAVTPGANAWENGRTVQSRLEEVDVRR
jgi:hypothetical protein